MSGRGGDGWRSAAARFAARATRRARAGRFLPALAVGAGVGAGACVLGKSAGADGATPVVLLGVGAALGAAVGAALAARVRRVLPGDAAWALDRLAGAQGRGLAAATLEGPAASEAVWASPPLALPPRPTLRPPAGLLPACAALLLAVLALVWPARRGDAAVGEGGAATTPRAAGGVGAADAASADRAAREMERAVETARRARDALGLPARSFVDAAAIRERLGAPGAAKAAREALPADSEVVRALDRGDATAAAEALARRLAAASPDDAAALRREAAALRGEAGAATVPPARRALVARYLAARLGNDGATR